MRNSPFRSIPSLHCRITSLAQRVGSLYVTEITENDEVKERPNEEIREIYVEDGRLSPIIWASSYVSLIIPGLKDVPRVMKIEELWGYMILLLN